MSTTPEALAATGALLRDSAPMIGLMGSFTLMPLQDVVDLLARRRASGNLICERGTVRKTLSLVGGAAVGASSNDPREYLGQLLINFGHITEEQLSKGFETQEETKIRLGKVLTMVGLVTPEVVRETLAIKIRETILDAFVWDSGMFRVEEAPPPTVTDDLDVEVPLAEIVREADFRATAWEAFRARFPSGSDGLSVDERRVPPGLPEGSIDARLLRLAREGKTIDEIGLALHATDFHLYQRLYALRQAGVIAAERTERGDLTPPRAPEPEEDPAQALALAARLRAELLDPCRTPRLKVKAHEIGLMRLSAAEKYLLGRCDGSRDLRQIMRLAPLTELEVLRAVRKFMEGRIVELR
jgi:hypothetical protein